jgi:hypothetical protein
MLMPYFRIHRWNQQELGRPPHPRLVDGMEVYPSRIPRDEALHLVFPTLDASDDFCTQIDQNHTVAAGASYGGYAIKCEYMLSINR